MNSVPNAEQAVQAAEQVLGVTPGYSVLHHRRFVVTLQAVLSNLRPGPNVRVADLGVWPGYQSLALHHAGYAVTGIDLLPNRLPELPFPVVQQNFNEQPELHLEPATYDAVIATEILEHLNPTVVTDFFRGIQQALRPGGYVILTTPNHRYVGSLFRSRVHGTDQEGHGHQHEYTMNELRDLLPDDWTDVEVFTFDAYRGVGMVSVQSYYRPIWQWWRHPRKLRNIFKLAMSAVQALLPPVRDSILVVARRRLDKKPVVL